MAEYGLTAEDGMAQIWFIDENGLSGGAEASNHILRFIWWLKPLTYFYRLPGMRRLQDRLYRWMADNRHLMPGSTAACKVEPKTQHEETLDL